MTTRLLPRDEWDRLIGTELESVCPMLEAESQARVIVVEDGTELVGCWALIPYWHAEGVWIAPAHREKGPAASRLLRSLFREAREIGAPVLLTASLTEAVTTMIHGLGGVELPGRHFVLPIGA